MILLYHLVFPDDTPRDKWNAGLVLRLRDFQRQISWVKRHNQLTSLEQYLNLKGQKKTAITFDDGYSRILNLIQPYLEKESVPITIFTTTSHLDDGRLLWFTYLNALCSENDYSTINIDSTTYPLSSPETRSAAWKKLIHLARESGDPIRYANTLQEKYPLSAETISMYAGLTRGQMSSTANQSLVNLGAHTHNHPYLDLLDKEKQLEQIELNKARLEGITGERVEYFAYPGGIYNRDSLECAHKAGFSAAFAVRPLGIGLQPEFEIPRLDIYSPSFVKFMIKMGYFRLRQLRHDNKPIRWSGSKTA